MERTASAVVTGAGMGIGLAVARRLAADGYHVVCVDWNAEALERAVVGLGSAASAVAGDIGDWSTHERAADAAEAAGSLRAWVNNAGIDWSSGAHEVDAERIDRGLRVLLNGPMYGTAVAVRASSTPRAPSATPPRSPSNGPNWMRTPSASRFRYPMRRPKGFLTAWPFCLGRLRH